MLIEFRVSNFRSFRDEQVFSMVASADKDLSNNLITDKALGKNRLLRSAVMYGANASGKSNFVKAIRFLRDFVESSANREIGLDIPVEPFLFGTETVNQPTKFSIIFVQNSVRYKYTLEINTSRIISEELLSFPKNLPQLWYSRLFSEEKNEYVFKFGSSLKGQRTQIQKLTRSDVLYLSNAAALNHAQLREIYNWFDEVLVIWDLSEFSTTDVLIDTLADRLRSSEKIKELAISWLQITDKNIVDISSSPIGEAYYSSASESLSTFDVQIHRSNKAVENGIITLPLDEESLGTKRLFAVTIPIASIFILDRVVIMDEIDTSLHPHLVRAIVQLVHDSRLQLTKGQLIFNTHDTTLLDSSLLRRDQIWFAEKNSENVSQIFSLWDFSPRKDESFARGYLQGRYGAIPFFGELVILIERLLVAKNINLGA